jgi:uncharacterized membrane protein
VKDKSHLRHIAKSITWRILATIDTIIIAWLVTGSFIIGLKIGFSEVLTKMVLYYLHERVWFKSTIKNSRKRHLLKTVSWRVFGTLDTMILSFFISGSSIFAFKIGSYEVISKMVLYYIHEEIWYKFKFGLKPK